MWQSPAIFLQHSISTFVIVDLGTHARAGVAVHTKPRTKDRMARHFAMTRCYIAPYKVASGAWPTQAGFWLEWGIAEIRRRVAHI